MKRNIALFFACICLSSALKGCASEYDADDFTGKTSAEIINEYGSFDCVTMPASEDGTYRNCRCGYTIKEAQNGFFGKIDELLFFIAFDENGIAAECEEGYRPGG